MCIKIPEALEEAGFSLHNGKKASFVYSITISCILYTPAILTEGNEVMRFIDVDTLRSLGVRRGRSFTLMSSDK